MRKLIVLVMTAWAACSAFGASTRLALDCRTGVKVTALATEVDVRYSLAWATGSRSPWTSDVDAVQVRLNGEVVVEAADDEAHQVVCTLDRMGTNVLQLVGLREGVEQSGGYTTLFRAVRHLTNVAVTASLESDLFTYDHGTAIRPQVVLMDSAREPDVSVSAYAPGDVDGDGLLSTNDVMKISRYNAWQKLSAANQEKFAMYRLEGSALAAADVTGDGVVDAADVTALNAILNSPYRLVEGTDYVVSYVDNIEAGTAQVIITGLAAYDGQLTLPFTIRKAVIGNGQEPGSGGVSSEGVSKYDVTSTYDGQAYTVDTNGIASIRVDGLVPDLDYSLDGVDWRTEPFIFTNACVTSVWYRLSVPNYETYVHETRLTIAPKDLLDESVQTELSCTVYAYDGNPKTPEVSVKDESIFRWQFVEAYAPGDVDGDGVLTEEDVEVLDLFVGYLEMDDGEKEFFEEFRLQGDAARAADVNGDGVVDAQDVEDLERSFTALVAGEDYALEYVDNVDGNPAKVVLTGTGNYGGTVVLPFTIGLHFSSEEITVSGYDGVYDGLSHAGRVTVPARATVEYAATADGAYQTEPPSFTDAGSYAVWYRVSAEGYLPTTGTVSVVLAPAPLTATAQGGSLVYGEPVNYGTVTYAGFVTGEDEGCLSGTLHLATENGSTVRDVGTYTVVPSGLTAENYDIRFVPGTLTVTRRPISLVSADKAKPYDGTALTLAAADVVVAGDGYVDGESFVLGGFASIRDAGSVPAAFEVGEGTAKASNYDISTTFGTLTVTRAATEVVVTADSGRWVYDGVAHTQPTWTATGLGALTAGDEIVVTFAEASSVRLPSEGVVSNVIQTLRVMRGTRDVTANYWLTARPGELVVDRRPVTLVSSDATKVYDGTALTADSVTVEGFVGTDGVTCVCSGSQTHAGTSENAFTYTFNAGTDGSNYAVTVRAGTLTVTALDISTGTAADWQVDLGEPLVYDGTEQTLEPVSLVFKGLPVACAVSGNRATDAGTYEMMLTGRDDFTGSATQAWSIRPRPITLTAPTKAKAYDGTPLTFTGEEIEVGGAGYATGERFAFDEISTIVDVGSVAASFTVVEEGPKLSNYDLSIVHGELTVTPNLTPIVVTAGSGTWVYDGEPHTNGTYAVENGSVLTVGDVLDVTFGADSVVTRPDDGKDGSVANVIANVRVMRGDRDVSANYTLRTQPGVLTVTRRPVSVTVKGQKGQFVYDATEKTVEGYTLVTEDALYDVTTMVSFSGQAQVARAEVGSAEMGLVAEQFANVDACFDVTFGVEDGRVVVVPADISEGDGFAAVVAGGHVYDGGPQMAELSSATYNDLPLTYEVAGNVATNAGTYAMTVVGTGSFTGTNTVAWTVARRPITLTAPTKTKAHDGEPLTFTENEISVGGDGYVAGEEFAYSGFAAITAVGRSPATFIYGDSETAQVANYEVTVTADRWLTVTKPKLSVEKGAVTSDGLTLSVGGSGDWVVHYTTDGSDPTEESPVYEGEIVFTCRGPQVVKVVAISETGEMSDIVVFEVASPRVVVSPASGTIFADELDVILSSDNSEAVVYYTLDGSEPDTNATRYTSLCISGRTTVKAVAVVDGWPWSETVVASYDKGVAPAPVITPADGSVFSNTVQYVTIESVIAGATIYYTLDGSEPTVESAIYGKPIKISETTTVKAFVRHVDYDDSPVVTSVVTRVRHLGDILDAPDVAFASKSSTPWFEDDTQSHGGKSSMRSGSISDEETTTLQATVEGAGRILFWWKASCESDPDTHDWDHAVFRVDRQEKRRLDGEGDWVLVDLEITGSGTHTLQWQYVKDFEGRSGEDCVWVDQFTWIPADGSAVTQLNETAVPYQWLYDMGQLMQTTPEEAVKQKTGKRTGDGILMSVADDYVAGTDPRNPNDVLRASVEVVDGEVRISWTPNLNAGAVARIYKVYGRTKLDEGDWETPVQPWHRFFKVSVAMPTGAAGEESAVAGEGM